jgi:hypothetical protein
MMDKGNVGYGNVIPGSVEVNYHTTSQTGMTRATVAGSDANGQDPLNVKDYANSNDLGGLNRDLSKAQTHSSKHETHVRVYLPVGDVREIVEKMMGVGVMSGSQESFDKEWDALIESANEVSDELMKADADEVEKDADTIDVAELLGEDWNGDVVVIEDDNGDEYLIYRGQWKNPFSAETQGYGWMKLNGDAEEGVGVLNIDFDADTQSSLFDLKSKDAHFVWKGYPGDSLQDRLNNLDFASQLASRIRVMHIEVNAFIAADVLEFPGHCCLRMINGRF